MERNITESVFYKLFQQFKKAIEITAEEKLREITLENYFNQIDNFQETSKNYRPYAIDSLESFLEVKFNEEIKGPLIKIKERYLEKAWKTAKNLDSVISDYKLREVIPYEKDLEKGKKEFLEVLENLLDLYNKIASWTVVSLNNFLQEPLIRVRMLERLRLIGEDGNIDLFMFVLRANLIVHAFSNLRSSFSYHLTESLDQSLNIKTETEENIDLLSKRKENKKFEYEVFLLDKTFKADFLEEGSNNLEFKRNIRLYLENAFHFFLTSDVVIDSFIQVFRDFRC